MADNLISLEKLKALWHSQVHDEEKWALNVIISRLCRTAGVFVLGPRKLLRAAGLFAGSIFLMRNFGDLMAV